MASKPTASIRKVKKPASAEVPAPAPTPTNMQRLWAIVRANPGASGAAILKEVEAIGIPGTSCWSMLSQLAKRGVLENRGTEASESPRCYWATTEAYPEPKKRSTGTAAASEPSETAPTVPVVPDSSLSPTAVAAEAAPPSPTPEPDTAPEPEPVAEPAIALQATAPAAPQPEAGAAPTEPAQSKSPQTGIRRVRWNQEEIEALCMTWAVEHITGGTGLSDRGLRKVASLEGHGYRPRDMIAVSRREFMAANMGLVERLVKDLRESKNKPTQAPDSAPALAAPAAAAAQPPAPEQQQPAAPLLQPEPGLTIGAMIDRAIEHTVQEAVKKALAVQEQTVQQAVKQALVVQEEKLLGALADMLRGIPGYNRPLVIKRTEPEPQPNENKPIYQVLIVGGFPAQLESVRRSFPQLDVRQSTDRIPAETDPDLVIGVIKWMSHPLAHATKKKYGERYCPVNGAADMIKSTIARKLQVQMAH